jgi:hypothetical protein
MQFRYKNLICWSWDNRLLIFHNRTDILGFWKFRYLVSQSGGFEPPYMPSFYNRFDWSAEKDGTRFFPRFVWNVFMKWLKWIFTMYILWWIFPWIIYRKSALVYQVSACQHPTLLWLFSQKFLWLRLKICLCFVLW